MRESARSDITQGVIKNPQKAKPSQIFSKFQDFACFVGKAKEPFIMPAVTAHKIATDIDDDIVLINSNETYVDAPKGSGNFKIFKYILSAFENVYGKKCAPTSIWNNHCHNLYFGCLLTRDAPTRVY